MRVVDNINGTGFFFFDLGKEIQGGIILDIALPAAVAASKDPLDRTVVVTVAEELEGGKQTPNQIMYPPRTGTRPQMTWVLAPTTDVQRISQYEYGEFRYGTLAFGNRASQPDSLRNTGDSESSSYSSSPSPSSSPLSSSSFSSSSSSSSSSSLPRTLPPVEAAMFNVSAWVVRLTHDAPFQAAMETSSPTLDQVWELCRYTVAATALDLYSDSNARQRSVDCMADDVTAMQSHYATTTQVALQYYATQQAVSKGPDSRVDWAMLPIIAVYNHVR